ncbi:TonB-dependent receptor [Thalassomonas sp. RHCl1]|uniref:TonB-dependent receptor plug domain-containing protein n=1 Tax=Thalassomonas sp. RHCl1 TaxID=2995320 RepID=UPI00248C7B09|nr:TonB-dependent receptor [Thalassomonas sp. RHCl1]
MHGFFFGRVINNITSILFVCTSCCYAKANLSQQSSDDDLFSLSLEQLLAIPITVASTQPESLLDTGSTVSVITAKDIQTYGYQSISGAISKLAGVEVIHSYFQKNLTTIRGVLQDNYANKVLVMINDVPSWDGTYSDNKLNRINIRDVERIEVLKGPSSVLYGTNAYSGVINIKLKDQRPAYANANFQLGNHSHHVLNYSQNFDVFEQSKLFLALSKKRQAKQQRDFTAENQETAQVTDFIDNDNISAVLTHGKHKILANAYEIDENFFAFVPFFSRAGGPLKNEGYMFSYGYENEFGEQGKLNYLFAYDRTEKSYYRFADKRESSRRKSRRIHHQLSFNKVLTDSYSLELGVDYDTRRSLDFSNYDFAGNFILGQNITGRSLSSYAFWSQLGVNHSKHHWLFGVRNTENELFGSNLSGRLSYRYDLSAKQRIKFIAAQSYRSPSIFELFFIDIGAGVHGNRELNPETSDSFEVSYLSVAPNWSLQATAYYAFYDNKIFRRIGDLILEDGTVAPNVNIYNNGEEFTGYGIEIETRYQSLNNWGAMLSANYLDGDDGDKAGRDEHYNFKFVPNYYLSLGLNKPWHNVTLAAMLSYRSSSRGPEFPINSSITLDINASYTQRLAGYQLSHNIKVNNLTKEQVNMAEYVRRRGVNQVPITQGRSISYQLSILF